MALTQKNTKKLKNANISLVEEKEMLYQIIADYQEQNKSLYNTITMLNEELKTLNEYKQGQELKSSIVINDYIYNCRPRWSFSNSRIRKVLDADYKQNKANYKKIIDQILSYKDDLLDISKFVVNEVEPYWQNGWLPPIDGAMLYATIASKNPRYYVECGSGNTTKFVAHAIRKNNLRTKIISIDPYPRAEIDDLCETVYRLPLEKMDLDFFSTLSNEDIFIVDNSHRSLPNSDVTVFFTEILPELPEGLIYALHDIALPNEIFTERYYNEQYMLALYLISGAMGDKIYFPLSYIGTYTSLFTELTDKLSSDKLKLNFQSTSGFFWMQKK